MSILISNEMLVMGATKLIMLGDIVSITTFMAVVALVSFLIVRTKDRSNDSNPDPF